MRKTKFKGHYTWAEKAEGGGGRRRASSACGFREAEQELQNEAGRNDGGSPSKEQKQASTMAPSGKGKIIDELLKDAPPGQIKEVLQDGGARKRGAAGSGQVPRAVGRRPWRLGGRRAGALRLRGGPLVGGHGPTLR